MDPVCFWTAPARNFGSFLPGLIVYFMVTGDLIKELEIFSHLPIQIKFSPSKNLFGVESFQVSHVQTPVAGVKVFQLVFDQTKLICFSWHKY